MGTTEPAAKVGLDGSEREKVIRRRGRGDETLAEIDRSYNVGG